MALDLHKAATLDLNADQFNAIQRGEAIRLSTTGLGEIIIVKASASEADEKVIAEWVKLGKKAADRWAWENPF